MGICHYHYLQIGGRPALRYNACVLYIIDINTNARAEEVIACLKGKYSDGGCYKIHHRIVDRGAGELALYLIIEGRQEVHNPL
ncbi:hypothetical protein CJD36_012450 [Flavipsychrobacter stenotrophus]|uniref:Uncharacterized protein n=1 Tax=Flavipsychrobacter stenotrophus TaxID=2077091 RepID=A0A2S7SVM1_9BACT|nr:hypothetical protein CJD36_012450 [Flavipsychrobacter stenotrophus]